jgi:hypothetical protein
MKKSYLRAGAAALACALGLSACGGSSGSLLLGGVIRGVTKDGLVLQNNGGHDYAPTAAELASSGGQFYFPDLIEVDEAYNITVKAVPSNVESCTVTNDKGRSAFNVSSILVVCTLKNHHLTGNVTGLGGASGLVLVNGTDNVPVTPDANATVIPFKMKDVGEDVPYGIAVLSNPTGLACSVTNGSGTMGTSDISNVMVNCVPSHRLAGTITISGVSSASSLVLANGADSKTIAAGATSFDMTPVGKGAAYNITVKTNPTGLACSVANGSGTMGDSDVTNVAVTCNPAS